MRRRSIAAASLAAAITLGFASAASANNSFPVAPENVHATDAPVVSNTYGPGGEVHYDVEPTHLVLSEFTSARDVEWLQWGPDVAIGTADIYGTWIDGEKYEDVTVVLYSVEDGYFTEFRVSGAFEQPEHQADITHGYIPGYLG